MINARELLEKTFRTLASEGKLEELKQLYIQNKIDINSVGEGTKRSALHWASERGHQDVVEYLLARDASPFLKDRNGDTSRDLAFSNKHHGIVVVLDRYMSSRAPEMACRGRDEIFASISDTVAMIDEIKKRCPIPGVFNT